MINGDVKKAYLFRKADHSGSWLAEGEEIMGWKDGREYRTAALHSTMRGCPA